MIDAGIEDPSSQDGIDFCVGSCPYEKGCILFDALPREKRAAQEAKVAFAKNLYAHGVSVADISLILRCCTRTAERYLAK